MPFLDVPDILTNRIPFQFIYQAYDDSYDNILYGVRNFLDRALTMRTNLVPDSFTYSFEAKVSEFFPAEYQWHTTVFVNLFEPISLNSKLFEELMNLFRKQVSTFAWRPLSGKKLQLVCCSKDSNQIVHTHVKISYTRLNNHTQGLWPPHYRTWVKI